MAEFTQVLKERRSIRKYQDQPVADGDLNRILEAVMWSPSWANTQCWEVVVVKDAATKEKLQNAIGPRNPATKAVTAAPVVLALCGKKLSSGYYNGQVTTKHGDWMLFDLGIACQSICLAAKDLGLGTVVVGMYDHDKVNQAIGVPEGYDNVALIPLGYPDQDPKAPKRRPVEEFAHPEKW